MNFFSIFFVCTLFLIVFIVNYMTEQQTYLSVTWRLEIWNGDQRLRRELCSLHTYSPWTCPTLNTTLSSAVCKNVSHVVKTFDLI